MRCGWCKRKGITAGEDHHIPRTNAVCQGYETWVSLAQARASQDRSGTPREIRG